MICSATFFFPRKPRPEANKPVNSEIDNSRLFTILAIVLHKQLVKAIGWQLLGLEGSLMEFGTATIVAAVHEGGMFRIPKWSQTLRAEGIKNFPEDLKKKKKKFGLTA